MATCPKGGKSSVISIRTPQYNIKCYIWLGVSHCGMNAATRTPLVKQRVLRIKNAHWTPTKTSITRSDLVFSIYDLLLLILHNALRNLVCFCAPKSIRLGVCPSTLRFQLQFMLSFLKGKQLHKILHQKNCRYILGQFNFGSEGLKMPRQSARN